MFKKALMRKLFCFALLSALVLGMVSCEKDDGEPNVILSVEAPLPATKSISDGSGIDILYFQVFNSKGEPIDSDGYYGVIDFKGGKASLQMKFVKNFAYKVVFWAQNSSCTAYDMSEFNTKGRIKVNYGGAANDDNRDAFYKMHEISVKGRVNESVVLRRPFAQINFLADDFGIIQAMELDKEMTSTLIVSGDVPNVLNGLDGTVECEEDAEFTVAALPSDPEYVKIGGESYRWVSMNYILAPDNSDVLTKVNAKFVNQVAGTTQSINVPNLRYQRNYKTNVIGRFFTESVVLTVVVSSDFDKPDLVY